jgi:hypothetical protein
VAGMDAEADDFKREIEAAGKEADLTSATLRD